MAEKAPVCERRPEQEAPLWHVSSISLLWCTIRGVESLS